MRPLQILLVEDDPADERLLRAVLADARSIAFELHRVALVAELADVPDVIDLALVDLNLPDSRGLATLDAVRERLPDIPVVVLTGLDDDATALLAIDHGAQDYLPKSEVDVTTLTRTLRHAIERHRLQWQQRHTAELALEREQRFRALFDNHPDAVIEVAPDGRCRSWNPAALALLHRSAAADVPLSRFIIDGGADRFTGLLDAAMHGRAGSADFRLLAGPGQAFDATVTAMPVVGETGPASGAFVVLQDITQRRVDEAATRHLAAIVRSADISIVSVDLDDRVLSWNAGAERLSGYAAADVVGSVHTDLLPAEQRGGWQDVRAAALEGRTVAFETVLRRKDGRTTDVHLTVSPILDDHGAPVAISVIARDISFVKAAERALLDSERRFRVLAENAQDVVYLRVFDPTPHYDYMSPSLSTVLGYDPIECYRDPEFITSRVHPDDRDELLVGRVPTHERTTSTFRVRHADGTWRWMENHTSPVTDGAGRVIGRQGITRDVTAHRVAEAQIEAYARQLEELNADLRAASRLREDLLSVVSHELRTPLTPILGITQLFLRRWPEDLPADRLQLLEAIDRNARRMLRLVDELITVSQATAGVLHANRQEVSIVRAVRDALVDQSPDTSDVRLVATGDVTALVDPGHLYQIVTNLVSNARRYGAAPILIEVDRVEGVTELRVRDHGEGVPGEFVDQLFERFSQASTGDTRTAAGMGLGLYLVQQLVSANGATIGYEHNQPTGACFTVRFGTASDTAGDDTEAPSSAAPLPPVRREAPASAGSEDALLGVATRRILHATSIDEIVDVLLDVVADAGGNTVRADEANAHAWPVDLTLGTGRPILPVAEPGTPARSFLDRHLPGLIEDANRVAALIENGTIEPAPVDDTGAIDRTTFERMLRRLGRSDVVAILEVHHDPTRGEHPDLPLEAKVADLSASLRGALRCGDRVARVGGHLVGVVLHDTDVASAAAAIERMRENWRAASEVSIDFTATVVPAAHRDILLPPLDVAPSVP